MEDFLNNPGLFHIGEEILKNLDFKTKVCSRLVKKSWKRALDKTAPKVGLDDLLKILQIDLVIPHEKFFPPYLHYMLESIHKSWSDLLVRIHSEEDNPWIFVMIKNLFRELMQARIKKGKRSLFSPFKTFESKGNFTFVKFILENNLCLTYEIQSLDMSKVVKNKKIELMTHLKPHLTKNQLRDVIKFATQYGHVEFLRLIVPDFDCDLLSTNQGDTLAHKAARKGHATILEFLFSHTKLLPTAKDHSGKTPLFVAVNNNKAETVKIIANHLSENQLLEIATKQYTYRWTTAVRNRFGFKQEGNLFEIAARHGYYVVLNNLCQKVPNPNVPGKNGNTALHCAARSGNFEIVKLLTSYTSKINVPDDFGVSPAKCARLNGFDEIANYLERMASKRKFDEIS